MPRKAATVKSAPEPAEEAGVPIVVRRAIIKDDAAAESIAAKDDNGLETRPKKSRIEPLTTPTEEAEAEPKTAEPVLDLSAKAEAPKAAEQPPAAEVTAPAPKPEEAAKAEPAPAAETKPEEPAAAETDDEKPAEPASGFDLGSGEAETETPDDPSQNPIDQAKAKADKEAAEKQAALDKLVDAETYFLPLNSVEKRRTKQLLLVTLLFVVVLAGAGAFWANGQGYISIPGL
jgi:hypothetical protein